MERTEVAYIAFGGHPRECDQERRLQPENAKADPFQVASFVPLEGD